MGFKIGSVAVQDESINRTLEQLQENHPFFKKWGLAKGELSPDAARLLNPVADSVVNGDDLTEINRMIQYEGGKELAPAAFGNLARYVGQLMPQAVPPVEGLQEKIPAEFKRFGFEMIIYQGAPCLLTSVRTDLGEQRIFSAIPTDTSLIIPGKPPLFTAVTANCTWNGYLQISVETNYGEYGLFIVDPGTLTGSYIERDPAGKDHYYDGLRFYETVPNEEVPHLAPPQVSPSIYHRPVPSKPISPLPTDKLTQAVMNTLPQEGNQVISSYSVLEALTLLFAGLSDAEYKRVAEKLGLNPDLHAQFEQMFALREARGPGGGILMSANRVFATPGTLTSEYQQTVELTEGMSFKNPEKARTAINKWISDNTGGMIPDLLRPGDVSSATTLVLANALYFKGEWASPFDEKKTTNEPFHVPGEANPPKVPMMNQNGSFSHVALPDFEAVKFPFQGEGLSMIVVLPKEGKTFSPTDAGYRDLLPQLSKTYMAVALPRFETETALKLNDALKSLGLGDLLNGSADYSRMTKDKIRQVDVMTKIKFKVDEKGAEGAAATVAVPMRGGAWFNADRPFTFAVMDENTGTVIFSGRVDDPRKKS